jgi:hypothetical protein
MLYEAPSEQRHNLSCVHYKLIAVLSFQLKLSRIALKNSALWRSAYDVSYKLFSHITVDIVSELTNVVFPEC